MNVANAYAGQRLRIVALPAVLERALRPAQLPEAERRLVGRLGYYEGVSPGGLVWCRLDGGQEVFLPPDCLEVYLGSEAMLSQG